MQDKQILIIIVIAMAIALIVIISFFIYRDKIQKKKEKEKFKREFDEFWENRPKPTTEEKSPLSDKQTQKREYQVKKSLMTNNELEYYRAIRATLPSSLILQPQVNLATIIDKISDERYINELFRNIDFCIFNSDFKPLILIEINDKTHSTEKSRMARDYKVKDICENANIPLITFWTKYGVNYEYIERRIRAALSEINP